MPANAGVDHRGPRLLNFLSKLHHFLMSRTVRDEINHAQTIDNDEVLADSGPHALHDLDRKAHAVLI